MASTPISKSEKATPAERLLEFSNNHLLIDLCGGFDRNLSALEQGFDIVIVRRTMDNLQVALNAFDTAMRTVVSHSSSNAAMPSFFEDLCSLFHDRLLCTKV